VLERVAGRWLEFAVRLRDGDRPVAIGPVTWVVMDTASFLRDAGIGAGPPRERAAGDGRPPVSAPGQQGLPLHC
jgi:hypothetical protein